MEPEDAPVPPAEPAAPAARLVVAAAEVVRFAVVEFAPFFEVTPAAFAASPEITVT